MLTSIPPRRVLYFPYSNNVLDQTAFYLEHGYEDNVPEGWYDCVQFMIVLWNKDDPSCFIHHSKSPYSLLTCLC